MRALVLADFGSTYTKLSLVDPEEGRLVARAEAPTTIATDLMDGYEAALKKATVALGEPVEVEHRLAASSAGGGLRVAAVGLVADLTAAAARQAALNAGARVGAVLAGRLGAGQLEELRKTEPEIVLFAGGTDGGQVELVLENAERLAGARIDAHFIVACNSQVAKEAKSLLGAGGARAVVAANVMPKLGELEIQPAREAILRAFLEQVIGGKRLSASPEFGRMVQMPTPEAVLEAVRLLSLGTDRFAGVGDLMVVDVGGATTDVHSSRVLEAATPGIEEPLLPPPPTLRTVEGDLGLRAGAAGALAADRRWLEAEGEIDATEIGRGVAFRSGDAKWIPVTPAEAQLDRLLAVGCATHAIRRHCGTMVLSRREGGPPTLARNGPDLREVERVIGTGGVFAHRDDGREILGAALGRRAPHSLAPLDPAVSVDANYIVAAAGLLAASEPELAIELLRGELLVGEEETG